MNTALDEHLSRRSAARWFARLRSGAVSESTDASFRRWLDRDPTHERELERSELLWSLLGDLEHDPEVYGWTQSARGRSLTGARAHGAGNRFSTTRRWVGLATAASLLIAGALWIALPAQHLSRPTTTLPPAEQLYRTAVGEHRRVTLGDGSSIELNTATRLRVTFTAQARQVHLDEGEALFFVHHDTSRPFNVSAGETMTRDVGTTFNVLSVTGRTRITVLEGRVQVTARPTGTRSVQGGIASDQPATLTLSAGESTNSNAQGGLSSVASGDLDRIESWRSGRVEFRDVPLPEALSDFNRYSETRIVVGDASLNAIHLSGVFRAGDVQALTRALASAFHIRSTPRPDSRTVVLTGAGTGH